jgi:hypothetical protein
MPINGTVAPAAPTAQKKPGFNPAATHFLPTRPIPKHWQTQCRWTLPPNDGGKGVDNCRFGAKCHYGHPGDEYVEYPGTKQTFIDGMNSSALGGMAFKHHEDQTQFALNPGVVNPGAVNLQTQRPIIANNHNHGQPVFGGFFASLMPQQPPPSPPPPPPQYGITQMFFASPGYAFQPGAVPFPQQWNPNIERNSVQIYPTEAVPTSNGQNLSVGYQGPVIVKSPEPSRPVPPAERMVHRRSVSGGSGSSKELGLAAKAPTSNSGPRIPENRV